MDKDKIYLLIASSVMVFLGCLRSWFSVTTGYLLPDEGLYYHATLGNFYIRPSYTLLLTAFKKVFFIESVFDMLKLAGFVGVISTIGVFFVYYKILKVTCEKEVVRRYSLMTLLFMPLLMLLGVTWITEAPAFFLIMLSVLCIVMYFKTYQYKYILISLVVLFPSSMLRENCWVFFAGFTFLLVYLKVFRKEKINWLVIVTFIISTFYTVPYIVLEFVGIPKIFVHQFPMLTEVTGTTVPIFGITPERYSVISQLPSAIGNFFLASSIAYGIVPLILVFMGILLAFYDLYKKRSNTISTVLSFTAFLGFVTFALFCIRLSTFSLVYMSTVIRFAYVSFPAILVIPKVYSFLKPKWRKIMFGLTPLLLVFVAFVGLPLIQSGLTMAPIDVNFQSGYETPYFKAYKYITKLNSRVCLFAEPFVRISLFLNGDTNVTLYSFYTSQYNNMTFDRIIHYEYWDKILIYGEFYRNYFLSLETNSPFFCELLQNKTSYEVRQIWWDTESYMVEVVVE